MPLRCGLLVCCAWLTANAQTRSRAAATLDRAGPQSKQLDGNAPGIKSTLQTNQSDVAPGSQNRGRNATATANSTQETFKNASDGNQTANQSQSAQERRLHPHGPIWPRQPTGHPGVECEPSGYSVRYDPVYYRESDLWGYVHDFDVSDKRYRFPEDFGPRYYGHPPGFYAATVYNSSPSGASLYLVSKQVAYEDLEYLECLGIKAAVVLDENGWIEHHFLQTRPSHVFYGQVFPPIPISITEATEWFIWYDQIEAFLDAQMAAGNTTMVYDDREGCWWAAAVALLYLMRKENLDYHDAFDRVLPLRPCIADLTTEEDLQWVDERLHVWDVCGTQRYCPQNPYHIPRKWPFTQEENDAAR